MKGLKLSFVVLMVTLLIGISGMAYAFHSGGVGYCEGCHSMHNSFEGTTNVTNRAFAQGTGPYLLKANDQSGVCLNCHADPNVGASSYRVVTPGVNPNEQTTTPAGMSPGGDFAWLKKTMNITIGGVQTIDGNLGERHGHNIVAADFSYIADTKLSVAPGSSNNYPAANLGCHSCHDPHGRYRRDATGAQSTTGLPIFNSGSYNNSPNPIATVSAVGVYRLLGGVGYQPKSMTGSYSFANKAPDVVVAETYNRSEAVSQTGIAYGQNMSEWCANCHFNMLQGSYTLGQVGHRHLTGNSAKLSSDIVSNYNTYVRSGIMTNATAAAAFSTLAPFEIGTADYAVLKAAAVTSTTYSNQNMPAASTSNNVSCLSCHRAHASGFESALRWFYNNEFMTIADSANVAIYDSSTTDNKINYGYSQAQQQAAYYDRPATVFGPYARVYCNKCHAKD